MEQVTGAMERPKIEEERECTQCLKSKTKRYWGNGEWDRRGLCVSCKRLNSLTAAMSDKYMVQKCPLCHVEWDEQMYADGREKPFWRYCPKGDADAVGMGGRCPDDKRVRRNNCKERIYKAENEI